MVNGLKSAEVVAAADPARDLLQALRQSMPNLATYENHEQMLASESLDAAVIAAPNDLHVAISLACVAKRVPFLVEKPLCLRAGDARELLVKLEKTPLTNAVGYMGRHVDVFAKGKQILQAQPLGKLVHLRCSMYVGQLFKRGKGWRYDKEKSGGGVLITQNSHLLDHLQWYFGPVEWVSGHVKSWYSAQVEDFAHAYLGFKSGLTGYLDASWSMRHYRAPEISIDVHGENGTLTVTDDTVRLFLDRERNGYPAGWSTWRKPDLYRPVPIDVGGPQYTHQDAEFINAVAEGRMVECDVRSAYHVQQVIDAVYESSAAGGRRVVISGDA